MTSTSTVLFPQQLGLITLPKTISILFVIKSINAVVVKPGFISESTAYNLGWNFFTNNTVTLGHSLYFLAHALYLSREEEKGQALTNSRLTQYLLRDHHHLDHLHFLKVSHFFYMDHKIMFFLFHFNFKLLRFKVKLLN